MQVTGTSIARAVALVLLAGCGSLERAERASLEPFRLTPASSESWIEYVLPEEEETAWLRIPWRSTFADGLRDAAAERKPVLFWGMNGHPLGAT